MSFSSITSSPVRISTDAIQSNGGSDAVLSFPISFFLPEISSRSLVRLPNLTAFSFQSHLLLLGSAVAVERIFSGGRDTISLRRASLKPETIRTLMIVKQRLRLARMAVKEMIGGT
jgi:hypothetical protein